MNPQSENLPSAEQLPKDLPEDKWFELFYARATDHYTLARQSLHNTHQWAITLIFGLVTAVLTISSASNPYPNDMGFIALLLSFPLMFRFFVRSCLEYSIHEKWRVIRETIDQYYYCCKLDPKKEKDAKNYLLEVIDLYYFKWKSPSTLWSIAWSNLKLAYLWPFILYLFFIIWGASVLYMTPIIGAVSIITTGFMVYEIIMFIIYRGFEYKKPTSQCPWNK